MEQRYDLTDIFNVITKAMDNPWMKVICSASVDALGIKYPVAGFFADKILSEYSNFKLSLLLKGLSTGFGTEKRLNELYNYVNLSQENAINVANLLRKTVNAECPKACVIYGLILASHLGSNTEFTQDELIVCKALENATDRDLLNFKEIMEKYLKQAANGNKIVFPKEFTHLDEFITTCDWGVYNRIFISRMGEWGEMEEGSFDLTTYYYVAKPATVLMKYIKDARQTWDYGS